MNKVKAKGQSRIWRRRNLIILTAFAAIFLIWRASTSDASIQYETAFVTRGNVSRYIVTTGSLKPINLVQVGAETSGLVSEIYVDFNTPVSKGQQLAQVDSKRFELALVRANAALDAAKARVVQAKANLERANITYTNTLKKNQRTHQLNSQGFASQASKDDIEAELQATNATRLEAQGQLALATAEVARAEAEVGVAKLDLDRTKIISPIDGVIVNRAINPGQTLASSFQTPVLFEIATNLQKMQVEAAIVEADIDEIKVGQNAEFQVDAYPNRIFKGHVTHIRQTPNVQNGLVSYTVIINVDNQDNLLLPGMTARVKVLTTSKNNVLRVPSSTLNYHPNVEESGILGYSVSIVAEEDVDAFKARRQLSSQPRDPENPTLWRVKPFSDDDPLPVRVELGVIGETYTEIISENISEGDEVVHAINIE